MKKLIALMLLLGWGSAWAIPVTWTPEGVVFEDGGTASGSFVFDADTSTYSDTDIVTTAGSMLSGETYSSDGNTFTFPVAVAFVSDGGSPFTDLVLVFNGPGGLFGPNPLTNLGGYVTLDILNGGEKGAPQIGEPFRPFVSGSVFGVAVPIPAAVWLFGSALAGLGWIRRRKTA